MLVHKNKTHRNAGVTQQVSPTASGLPGRPLILRVGRVGAAERGRECNTHTHTHTHTQPSVPACLPACLPALGRARPKMLHLVALGCLFFPGLFLLSRRALHNAEPALTDGDLVCLSVRIVSSVQAMMAVITGVVITSSCNHVMKDSHWISKAYILFGTPYMVYDIYAMYLCHWYKYNGKYNSSFSFVTSFLKKNPLIILHHLVLFLVCFPIILFYRKGLGDFFLGCLLLAEMSTPFVSLAKILRQLKKQDTLLYKINGVVVLVTFFVCRILVFPFMYWAYGRQYGIPAYRVPFHIPWHCTVANGLIMAPQLYWLTQILKKAVKIVKVE